MNLQFPVGNARKIISNLRRLLDAAAHINSVLILTAVFIVVVLPVGILFRLSGRSIFRKDGGSSSWSVRDTMRELDKPF